MVLLVTPKVTTLLHTYGVQKLFFVLNPQLSPFLPEGAVSLHQRCGAGGYALQSRALRRFAYKSEICKQNQQGFASKVYKNLTRYCLGFAYKSTICKQNLAKRSFAYKYYLVLLILVLFTTTFLLNKS